jgi:hypothetical protein
MGIEPLKNLPVLIIFAGLIAAAIHDVAHPGFNNLFLISTVSPIAVRYNDISVCLQF